MRRIAGCLILLIAVARLGAAEPRTIVCFGDSLTAGYGLDDPDSQSYPALIQRKIDAAGLPWRVVNAGLSGETTAGGLRRVDWILQQPIDIFLLASGGNDGLRGIDPALTRANLVGIIEKVRARYPSAKIVLAGLMMPPNMGQEYTAAFAATYPWVANKEHVALIPFLLEGVGGHPDLNQADGVHPTAEGDVIVAENIWRFLAPLLVRH